MRIPSRAKRRAGAAKPPTGAVMTYQRALRAWLTEYHAFILPLILKDWERNPVHFSGAIPRDGHLTRADGSQFVTQALGHIDLAISQKFKPEDLAPTVSAVATRVNKKGLLEFQRVIPVSLRSSMNVGIGAGAMLDSFRSRNVDLIKSLQGKELDEITDVLGTAEAGAWRVEELRSALQDRFDVSKSKADLLARDQTLKLYGQVTKLRQTQAGVSKYVWTTSGDERVRDDHEALDGQVFVWGQPPVTDTRTGATNEPGEDYQCRCTAFPIIPELDDPEPDA